MFKKGDIIFSSKEEFHPVIYLGSETTGPETSILFCRDVPGIIYGEKTFWKIFIDTGNVQIYLIYTDLDQWIKMPMRKLNRLIKKIQSAPEEPSKTKKPPDKPMTSRPKGPDPLPRRSPQVPPPPAGPPVPGQPGGGRFAGWVE